MGRIATRDEDGAVLLLAVIFVLVISLILVALVSLSGNDLLDTSNLITQQNTQYAASGAADVALDNVQHSDLALPASPGAPANCLPTSPLTPLSGGPQMVANCSYGPTQGYGPWNVQGSVYGPYTRQLYIYVCPFPSSSCGSGGTSAPAVTAVIELVDGPTCSPTSVAECGQQAIIESWQDSTA